MRNSEVSPFASGSLGEGAVLAIEMLGISKRFGHVLANEDVCLRVRQGTIHGIVGENGAGKSTIMSILYGFYEADAGTIALHGKPVTIRHSTDAIAHGVGMVHQHFMLVETLSALDNVLLGSEKGFLLDASRRYARAALQTLMQRHHLPVDLEQTVQNMPVGEQQRLEILKALYRGAKILILDEPTAVLTPQEVEAFFEVLRELRAQGVTVVIITHKLHEIMRLTDHVTVMRQGRVVADLRTQDTNPQALAEWMVGRPVNNQTHRQPHDWATSPLRLKVEGLRYRDARGVLRVDNVGFELRAGEIVGVAGVSGNGQSELLALISGMLTPQAGRMTVVDAVDEASDGVQEVAASSYIYDAGRWLNARALRDRGMALVPEDRLGEGVIKDFSMKESAILGYQSRPTLGNWWHLIQRKIEDYTQGLIKAFDIRPTLPSLRTANMSGGNQQKLVLAREMMRNPSILLVGQPTRGVDIGAIEQIYAALIKARDQGAAILVVSVELEEIFALSDRIMVMNKGKITGMVPGGGQTSAAEIGQLMTRED